MMKITQERLEGIRALKESTQEKLKGKKFGTLSTKDKDALLEIIAKMLGLIE